MIFELTGKLIEKFDTQQISDKFQKREFVIEIESEGKFNYTDYVKFQLMQDKCDLIENFNINDMIKVNFNIRGKKWEKDDKVSYFTNLNAWKIEIADGAGNEDLPIPDAPDVEMVDENDDLPF